MMKRLKAWGQWIFEKLISLTTLVCTVLAMTDLTPFFGAERALMIIAVVALIKNTIEVMSKTDAPVT